MISIFIFVLGTIFGSFFNVVGLRMPNNESIVKPASHCPNCKKKLKWYELIPVLSYILCLGKCNSCKKKISPIYPIIELLSGLLFLFGFILYGFSYEFYVFIIISSLANIIFVSDFKYMIILDSPLIICGVAVLVLKFTFLGFQEFIVSLMSGLTIFALMLLIRAIGNYLFKRESMGGGDIKLGAFIGIALGINLSAISLIIACFLAFPYAIYISFKNKTKEMPFGPFLIGGVLVTFVLIPKITEIISTLFPILK